jgi:hypothetical protein
VRGLAYSLVSDTPLTYASTNVLKRVGLDGVNASRIFSSIVKLAGYQQYAIYP